MLCISNGALQNILCLGSPLKPWSGTDDMSDKTVVNVFGTTTWFLLLFSRSLELDRVIIKKMRLLLWVIKCKRVQLHCRLRELFYKIGCLFTDKIFHVGNITTFKPQGGGKLARVMFNIFSSSHHMQNLIIRHNYVVRLFVQQRLGILTWNVTHLFTYPYRVVERTYWWQLLSSRGLPVFSVAVAML